MVSEHHSPHASREESLRIALESTETGAWHRTIGEDEIEWSESVAAVHGLPPGSTPNRLVDYLALLHPEDRPRFEAAVRRAVEHGEGYAAPPRRPIQVEYPDVRLCMFHPRETPLERGWVGRIDGDEIVHLAAQTLQAFFLGGGGAREHARYPLSGATLVAPVLQPPVVRVFEEQDRFAFANANAVTGPGAVVRAPARPLSVLARLAAVIGADEEIGGFTLLAEWRVAALPPPKDRDFALVLGPVLVTPDELGDPCPEATVRSSGRELARGRPAPFSWEAARALAAAGTRLRAGDVIAGPPAASAGIAETGPAEVEMAGIGPLPQTVA